MYQEGDKVICVKLPFDSTRYVIGEEYTVFFNEFKRPYINPRNEKGTGYLIDYILKDCFKLLEEPINLPAWF